MLLAVEEGAFEHDFLGLAGQRQTGDGGWLGRKAVSGGYEIDFTAVGD